MSLMRLLAVGRSIGTVSDQPSPYKMTQQNLLPRFGRAGAADEEMSGTEPAENTAAKVSVEPRAEPRVSLPRAGTETMHTGISEQSKNSAEVTTGFLRKVASPRKGWSLLRNPFQSRMGRRSGREPVQGELALNLIRPVRNDLNESDLEVVPQRRAGRETPAPAPLEAGVAGDQPEVTGAWWSRVCTRWLRIGAGQT